MNIIYHSKQSLLGERVRGRDGRLGCPEVGGEVWASATRHTKAVGRPASRRGPSGNTSHTRQCRTIRLQRLKVVRLLTIAGVTSAGDPVGAVFILGPMFASLWGQQPLVTWPCPPPPPPAAGDHSGANPQFEQAATGHTGTHPRDALGDGAPGSPGR